MRKSDTTTMSKRARRLIVGLRASAGILIVGGALSLYAGTSASASTLGGTATIASTTNQPLSGGGSETQFTVDLPAQAACSGDTATDGYHVFSYLIPQGTAVTSVTFTSAGPSTGWGLVDGSGYYGSVNTAPTTGEILTIPSDFEWADLTNLGETVSNLTSTGVWDAGLACAPDSGANANEVSDYWITQVTFTASTSDPNGFIWTDVPGTGSTTSTTAATTSTTAGTTSTTAGTTSTTAAGGSTSTTTASTSGNGTTTTVAGATGASGSTGSSGSSGSSTGATTDATPVSSGSLAFTGALITRGIAIGLLCIGFGLIMLGLSVKVRREIAPGIMLR
jgi:hypothetical protein